MEYKIYGTEWKLDILYKSVQQNGKIDRAILFLNIWMITSFYRGYC